MPLDLQTRRQTSVTVCECRERCRVGPSHTAGQYVAKLTTATPSTCSCRIGLAYVVTVSELLSRLAAYPANTHLHQQPLQPLLLMLLVSGHA